MSPYAKYLLAGVAVLTVAAGGVAIARHGQHGFGHHGWRHHGGQMGPMGFFGPGGRFCGKDSAEMADHMLVRLEHKIKPTEAQKPAFEDLKTAVKTAADKVQQACPAGAAQTAPGEQPATAQSPIERLAAAETMTAATLDAIKTVRPAAEKLYASLDDGQKKALSERWGKGRQGGGWRKHRDHGPDRGHDRSPDRGSDQTPGNDAPGDGPGNN